MFDTQELRAASPEVGEAQALQLPTAAPQPMHVLDRLNAVFKHRRLASVAFVLVVTTMMVQTYSTIPVYQASSRVQIQTCSQAGGIASLRMRASVSASRSARPSGRR